MGKSIFTARYAALLKQLRLSRARAGLTQAELARRLEQTQSFVSKCERGVRRLDVIELQAFCAAIGVDFKKFISSVLNKPDRS